MKKGIFGAAVLTLAMLIGGCLVTIEGEGEIGFRQQSTWSAYHRAHPNPQENKASAEIESRLVPDLAADEEKPAEEPGG